MHAQNRVSLIFRSLNSSLEMDDIEEVDDRSHALLTAAISKLDKSQHIKTPARSEPTNRTSEFDLVKTNRLDVQGLVGVLEHTGKHVEIGKSIKKTQAPDNVLPKPLEKPQAEKIKRSTAFENIRKKLGRWDSTVARNRTIDHLNFPLKTAVNKLIPTKEYLSKLKLKSELEKELDVIEGREDGELEEEEETYPMTYEEMLEHRKELAKLRAQQSFKAAKDKRQSKIKSKKYHRILKKERMKKQIEEFELLQKTDPEEALRRLESLERSRAEERHTLRHKNTGKWAKSKLVRAKYNTEVRQQLADQLAVSRALTQKVKKPNESSDDESEQDEAIPDIPVTQDPMNPWMLNNSAKSQAEEAFDFGYKKYVAENMRDDSSSDDEPTGKNQPHDHDETTKWKPVFSDQKQSLNQQNTVMIDNNKKSIESASANTTEDFKQGDTTTNKKKLAIETLKRTKEITKSVSTTNWTVQRVEVFSLTKTQNNKDCKNLAHEFDTLEEDISKKVQEKICQLRKDVEKNSTVTKSNKKRKSNEDNLSKLEFKNKKVRPIIDTELNETCNKNPDINIETKKSFNDLALQSTNSVIIDSTANVDPTSFIVAKPKYLVTSLTEDNDGFNNLDDEEQVVPKVNIEDVFEEDDVVASFRQEKEDEVNKDKPQDVDLSLPGWGSWGGKGVKSPKKKKSRFIVKMPPSLPRRDENKGDIIIKEFREPKLASHKVTELPFPFTSLKDFEASIRAPLGNTFITETAHKKVIKPNVSTKAGTVIDPMDDEELLRPRNLTFKNQAIIKLLGNK